MTGLLISLFLKKCDPSTTRGRQAYGKLSGIVGIICNLLLCGLKLAVGLLCGSIAITADATNNLSDAGSSIVTLVGFHLSGKPADPDHPYGHARAEYIGGLIVSFIVLLIGFSTGKSAIEKIIWPQPTQYLPASVWILVFSILLKGWMALFNRRLGKTINSGALEAAAVDSRNDMLATSAVLISTLVFRFFGIDLDGYMGLAVSLFILYSGYQLVKDMLDPLLGQAPSMEMVRSIEKKILSYDGVLGLHDLLVHSYGPGRYFASVHVEMDVNESTLYCHDVMDAIERDFLQHDNIHLVAHLDPLDTNDKLTATLRDRTVTLVAELDAHLTIHDFRVIVGADHHNLVFDVVLPIGFAMSDKEVIAHLKKAISGWSTKEISYYAVITVDHAIH
ncbi:MAG: cation transporter [Christensenellaceae bacterium]|nr:cation transporter [Christensenellaceae bacterium]